MRGKYSRTSGTRVYGLLDLSFDDEDDRTKSYYRDVTLFVGSGLASVRLTAQFNN